MQKFPLDLKIIFDASSAIKFETFEEIKSFANRILNSFDYSPDRVTAELYEFTDKVSKVFGYEELTSHKDTENLLNKLSYKGIEQGNTDSAIDFIKKTVGNPNRPVEKLFIVITNSPITEELAIAGVHVYAIGFDQLTTSDLEKIASIPEKVYKLDYANQMGDIIENLQSNICQGKDPCESAGCSHNCQRIENDAICSCPEDLMLDSDYRKCVPIGSTRGADMCKIQNGGCEHECIYDAPGYHCDCRVGYRLDENYRNCHDIDECVINNGGCSDKCVNYPGGHFCMCTNWREEKLGSDGKSCEPLCDRGFVYYGHACWRIYGKFDYWDAVDACKARMAILILFKLS